MLGAWSSRTTGCVAARPRSAQIATASRHAVRAAGGVRVGAPRTPATRRPRRATRTTQQTGKIAPRERSRRPAQAGRPIPPRPSTPDPGCRHLHHADRCPVGRAVARAAPDGRGAQTSEGELEIELGVEVRGIGAHRGPERGDGEFVGGRAGPERLEHSEQVVRLRGGGGRARRPRRRQRGLRGRPRAGAGLAVVEATPGRAPRRRTSGRRAASRRPAIACTARPAGSPGNHVSAPQRARVGART